MTVTLVGEAKTPILEIIRTRGFEFPWRPVPVAISLVLGSTAVVMVFLCVLNLMRNDQFGIAYVLFAIAIVALALLDFIPARPRICVNDTTLELWRGRTLGAEIACSELVSNALSYRLKGSVQSIDGKRRIWLYTKGIGDVVPERLYQLTDWASDHRDDIRRAGGSLTRAIFDKVSSTGIAFRPNSPDENIELGAGALFGACVVLLLQFYPISSWALWSAAATSVFGVAIAVWQMVSFSWRKRQTLHLDARGITHILTDGSRMSLAWEELRQPDVRARWMKARPDPAECRFQVFDVTGKLRINVGGNIRHVLVLDMIFEDMISKVSSD